MVSGLRRSVWALSGDRRDFEPVVTPVLCAYGGSIVAANWRDVVPAGVRRLFARSSGGGRGLRAAQKTARHRTSDRDYLPTVNLQPEKSSDDRVVEAPNNLFDRSVKDALRASYKK